MIGPFRFFCQEWIGMYFYAAFLHLFLFMIARENKNTKLKVWYMTWTILFLLAMCLSANQ